VSVTRALLAIAAVWAVLALTGCAPNDNGPLVVPFDDDMTCMEKEHYPEAAMGTILTNESAQKLTITDVVPIGQKNLQVSAQKLMPSPNMKLLADAYPPVDQFPDEWTHATDAYEGVVEPWETNLVLVTQLVLPDETDDGSIDGLEIHYRDQASNQYVERTEHQFRIKKGGC
jgi:hypothetical protein